VRRLIEPQTKPPTKMPGRTARSIRVRWISVDCKWRREGRSNLCEAGEGTQERARGSGVTGWVTGTSTMTKRPNHGDQTQSQRRLAAPRLSPGGHQGHLEMQGILTQRSFTFFITSERRRYERVDSKCSTYSRNRHFILQCLLGVCHSASDCCSVYQECLSSSLAASWTPSPGHHTIRCTTLWITIFWLGPWTQQGRGAHAGVSK